MAFQTGQGQNGHFQPMAEINVTPFVDVMLVLLVIFMVTAPMMTQGLKVDLPKADTKAMDVPDEKVTITVTKDSRIFIGGEEVALDRLTEILKANVKVQEQKEILLHADQDLPYRVIMQIMERAQKAGAEQIGMATEPGVGVPAH